MFFLCSNFLLKSSHLCLKLDCNSALRCVRERCGCFFLWHLPPASGTSCTSAPRLGNKQGRNQSTGQDPPPSPAWPRLACSVASLWNLVIIVSMRISVNWDYSGWRFNEYRSEEAAVLSHCYSVLIKASKVWIILWKS